MNWMQLLLIVFGVYRCARIVTQEDFVFDAFARFRGWIGQSSWVGRGAHCYACVSFWLAGVASVVLVLTNRAIWGDLWLLWPGIAGAAFVIYQVFR